jgi:transcriptional regulator with PAS, ATPase and Fis domain
LTLAEIEARVIREALGRNEGRKMATAAELGIDKTTLWRKIKRLGIDYN